MPGEGRPAAADVRDRAHLMLLARLHYLLAIVDGVAALWGFVSLAMGTLPPLAGGTPPLAGHDAQSVRTMLVGLGGALAFHGLVLAVLHVLAARSFAQQRRYPFLLGIGGVDLLLVPLGSLIGLFALVVLARSSVARRFDEIEDRGYVAEAARGYRTWLFPAIGVAAAAALLLITLFALLTLSLPLPAVAVGHRTGGGVAGDEEWRRPMERALDLARLDPNVTAELGSAIRLLEPLASSPGATLGPGRVVADVEIEGELQGRARRGLLSLRSHRSGARWELRAVAVELAESGLRVDVVADALGRGLAAACLAADWDRCNERGIAYFEAEPPEHLKAALHYELGCAADFRPSCHNLALVYSSGAQLEPDLERAAELFARACEPGGFILASCLGAARLLLADELPFRDAERAVRLLEVSCGHGHEESCSLLSQLRPARFDE